MDKAELEKKMRGKIIKVERIGTGITQRKLKLTFLDGSCAIFKPADGEGGGPSTAPPVVNEKEDHPDAR